MKRILFFILFSMLLGVLKTNAAPLTGTKYITSYNAHPLDYNTLAAAIADLNANGVGAGGVTFMMPPGYTETFTNGAAVIGPGVPTAYTITNGGMIITATGTALNQIIFQEDAYTTGAIPAIKPGQGSSTTSDAIITINGGDYISFNGVNLQENTATTPAGNFVTSGTSVATAMVKYMEFGYYIKNNGADGAQNNTIKNCSVTLQNYTATTGLSSYNTIAIYQLSNSSTGLNSGNTYLADTVITSYQGIVLNNSSTTADVGCTIQNCVVGSSTTGSIGSTVSFAGGAPYTVGIEGDYQSSFTVSGNEVQGVQYYRSNSVNAYGIYLFNNSGTCTVSNNKVHDIYNGNSSSGSGNLVYGISVASASGTVYIYNNRIYNILYIGGSGGTNRQTLGVGLAGAGTVYFYYNSIYLSGSTTSATAGLITTGVSLNLLNNIIKNGVTNGSSKKNYCFYFSGGTLSSYDYNIYDCAANGSGSSGFWTLFNGSDYVTLLAWQGGPCTRECNSKQITVTFLSDLHLSLTGCANDPNYQGTNITTPIAITTDCDGDTRSWPYRGADEVNFSSPNVLITSNQPVTNTVSKNDVNQVIGSFTVTPYGGATNFTGITVSAGSTTVPYGYIFALNSSSDFKNFKLWVDSTGATSFSTVTAGQIGSTITNTPTSNGGSLAFTSGTKLPLGLTGCKSYYFYITCDIGSPGTPIPPNAQSGANINTSYTLANVGISSGTKSGSAGTSGYQYIADRYYNFTGLEVTDPNSWYDATSFQPPNDFTSPYQIFQMIHTPADTMSLYFPTFPNWTISGTQSKLIIGDGVTNIVFPATQYYTGTVDVMNNATVKFKTSGTIANTVFGTLASGSPGSTIYYDSVFNQTVKGGKYFNLTLGGTRSSGNSITLVPYAATTDSINVAGSFTAPATFSGGGGYVTTSSIVTFNGTAVQTIPTFAFNILNIDNKSGTALNTSTNTGACVVNSGNTISVAAAASTFKVTTGNMIVNGTFSNTYSGGSVFGNTNIQLGFGSGGLYNFNGGGAATNAYLAPATWNTTSTAYITGLGALTANGVTGSTPGGTGKYGNLIFHNPNFSGTPKFFGSNWSGANTSVPVGGSLTLGSLGSSGLFQITTGAPTFSIDGDLNIYAGNWGFMHYANTNTITVLSNVNIDGSNATYSTSAPTLTLASNNAGAIGNLNVAGNFYMKSGAYTASFVQTAGTANLKLNGSGAQQQLTFATTSGAINLEMATGTNGAKLYSPVTLNGALKFTSGILSTDATNIPTLTTAATITGTPTNTTFVSGPMLRNTNAATEYVFPIGKIGASTPYRPFSVVPTTTTGSTFSGEYFPSAYSNLTIVDPVMIGVQTNEYWMVNRTLGTDNGRIKINYVNPGSGNWSPTDPCNLCNVAVAHFNASTNYWEFTNGAVLTFSSTVPEYAYYATNMAIYSKVLSSFSPFTGGFGWNFLLPVNLLSFSGANNNGVASLAWKTVTELNINQYIIERSVDGMHFENAGALAAKNLAGQNKYTFDDRSVPATGMVYYRLKIMSFNGQYKYSQVIALNFKKGNGIVQIFPNPVKNVLFMTHDKAAPGASVNIYSAVGSKIAEYPIVTGGMQTTLNITSLIPGVYSLRYENNNTVEIIRFTKL